MTMMGSESWNKAISIETARKLLGPKNMAEDILMKFAYKEHWPNDVDMVKIANAVERGSDTVTLLGNKRFLIVYVSPETVRVSPVEWYRFVPMGFFDRKKLKDAKATKIDTDNL